jgi:hypothetical protein
MRCLHEPRSEPNRELAHKALVMIRALKVAPQIEAFSLGHFLIATQILPSYVSGVPTHLDDFRTLPNRNPIEAMV